MMKKFSDKNIGWARDWGEIIRDVLKNLADVLFPKQPTPIPVPVRDKQGARR
jgi:hypothetical protein